MLILSSAASAGSPDHPWSVGGGGGISFGGSGLGLQSLGLAGISQQPGLSVRGVTTLEYRLSSSWAIQSVVRLRHSTVSSGSNSLLSYGLPVQGDEFSLLDLGTQLGVRYIVNPGSRVELSPVLTVGYSYSVANGTASDTGFEGQLRSDAVFGGLGMAADMELIEQLHLRMTLVFVEAGWGQTSSSTTDPAVENSDPNGNTFVGLGLDAQLELRLHF
jgi:hypothetical protein